MISVMGTEIVIHPPDSLSPITQTTCDTSKVFILVYFFRFLSLSQRDNYIGPEGASALATALNNMKETRFLYLVSLHYLLTYSALQAFVPRYASSLLFFL
jgi:hypothetical protein